MANGESIAKEDDPRAAARAARLRHVIDDIPGLARCGDEALALFRVGVRLFGCHAPWAF
jgi:hypothetical protein